MMFIVLAQCITSFMLQIHIAKKYLLLTLCSSNRFNYNSNTYDLKFLKILPYYALYHYTG